VQRPQTLRYRPEMKQSSRKLVLRSETLCIVAPVDLARVNGGSETGRKTGCTLSTLGSDSPQNAGVLATPMFEPESPQVAPCRAT
jgi:hypothetical protein